VDLVENDVESDTTDQDYTTIDRDLILWGDKEVRFKRSQGLRILDYIGDFLCEYSNGGPTLHNFPDWCLFNYLPFVDRKGYIKGLTEYCHSHGVTGMLAMENQTLW
jgi:hypothetical protein